MYLQGQDAVQRLIRLSKKCLSSSPSSNRGMALIRNDIVQDICLHKVLLGKHLFYEVHSKGKNKLKEIWKQKVVHLVSIRPVSELFTPSQGREVKCDNIRLLATSYSPS